MGRFVNVLLPPSPMRLNRSATISYYSWLIIIQLQTKLSYRVRNLVILFHAIIHFTRKRSIQTARYISRYFVGTWKIDSRYWTRGNGYSIGEQGRSNYLVTLITEWPR